MWQKIENRFLLGASSTYSLGSTGGEASHTLSVYEMPKHKHNDIISGYTGQKITVNGGSGADLADLGTGAGSLYGYSFSTSESGDNQPHNNMPPYLAVNIWKRIA